MSAVQRHAPKSREETLDGSGAFFWWRDGFYAAPANGAFDPNSNGKWVGTAAAV